MTPDTTPQALSAEQWESKAKYALDRMLRGEKPDGADFAALNNYIAHLESQLPKEYERGVKDGEVAQKERVVQFIRDRAFGLRRDATEAGHQERRAMRDTAMAYDTAADLVELNT